MTRGRFSIASDTELYIDPSQTDSCDVNYDLPENRALPTSRWKSPYLLRRRPIAPVTTQNASRVAVLPIDGLIDIDQNKRVTVRAKWGLDLFKGITMNKLFFVIVSGALMCSSIPSMAADHMKCGHGMMKMKNMDTDNDGTVSKEEFMKAHETMWDEMKKNKDGLVDVKEMQMMHKGMKKDKAMK